MNKLKAVFDLTRAIQKKRSRAGNMRAELRNGEELVGSWSGTFDLNHETGKGKVSHSMESAMNGGMKHSGEMEFSMDEKNCCHGHGFHGHRGPQGEHGHFKAHGHGFHGAPMCGRIGHMKKLSMLIAVLDGLQVEEKADGGRIYLLDMKAPGESFMELMKDEDCCKGETDCCHEEVACCGDDLKEGCCGGHGMKEFVHSIWKMEEKDGSLRIETDRDGNPVLVQLQGLGRSAGEKDRTISAEVNLK